MKGLDMIKQYGFLKMASAVGVLTMLAACGKTATNAANTYTKASDCVQIDEGNYLFQDGKFIRANATSAPIAERPAVQPTPVDNSKWYLDIERDLGARFDWISLDVRDDLAVLSGVAPDAATKTTAFETGKAAILAEPEGAGMNVIDAISVEGGDAGVGAALVDLGDAPTLAACQAAFAETMDGRNVQFRIGSATILPASARLLDALSGVASVCTPYNVEIGGHTDSIGDDALNQKLSQQRANSVRNYLESRNVDVGNVTAKGYGETRPIDTSGTRAGDALNRRTEFTVTAR